MEFLILFLGTSVASFCVEMANELRMFKDVADVGYKIDMERLSDLSEQLNPNGSKNTFLTMLIPIVNIILVLQRIIQYNNVRPMLLDQLNVMGVLEEMTEIEKIEYQKNPTGLNALIIPLKMKMRISKASSIKLDDDYEKSEIIYEADDSFCNITILKVNGSASRLSVDEQKKRIIEAYKNIVSPDIEKIDDNVLDLSYSVDEEKKECLNDTKEVLEKLKNELIDEQQKINVENGPVLIKKRK